MDNNIRLTYWDDNGIHYFLFDNNGVVIFKDILTQDNQESISNFDTLSYSELLKIHQENSRFSHIADDILLRHNDKMQIINLIDLIDEMHLDRDWDYEYVESLNITNKPYEIAFITHNPTYGVQGIKILKFNSSFDLDLVYEMEDLHFDGAFHNLTFNSNGDKYALLLYNHQDHKDYLTICEYSVKNVERSLNERPLSMFKTDFEYWEFGELNTEYLNDNILCIIRNSDLILFDLSKGKAIELIKRDLNSSYTINSHSVEYELNEKSCEININN